MAQRERPNQGQQGKHSHLMEFPEALEAIFQRAGELKSLLGPGSGDGVAHFEDLLRQALAARQRGDVPAAITHMMAGIELVAELASRNDPAEGAMMRAMAAQFRQALGRGAVGDARGAADVMRERSGTRVVPRKN